MVDLNKCIDRCGGPQSLKVINPATGKFFGEEDDAGSYNNKLVTGGPDYSKWLAAGGGGVGCSWSWHLDGPDHGGRGGGPGCACTCW